ncbi:hypothetical protein ACHAXR_008274 [Thalassiosira sp. AJA248-18]
MQDGCDDIFIIERQEEGEDKHRSPLATQKNINMGEPSGESSKKRRRKRSKKSTVTEEDNANAKTTVDSDNEDATPEKDVDDTPNKSNNEAVDDDAKPADNDAAAATEEGDDNAAEEPKKRKRKRNRKKKTSDSADGANNDSTPTDAEAAKLQSIEHTVFIEGLPFTSSEHAIRTFFAAHGCNDILQLRLPTWQDSGRLRGFGHVVFASQETRERALSDEVNGKELGGRYITVKEANAPKAGTTAGAVLGGQAREQPSGCKRLYVRNLPYEASEDQILETFSVCGKIVEGGVRVVRNHVNGMSKGFGYVEFKNEEGALAAVQKAAKPFGLLVMKRPVFVDYDEGAGPKGSFRDGEGKLWNKEHGNNAGGRGGSGRGGGGRGGGRGGRGRGGGRGFGMGGGRR